ncbi:hemerythrin domain-containing protein [Hydrogenophaga sp.]|uniref:hemerythrin domain-containing protein n=1 Tax=Hydrogenophaga sp. TaxID=1904254 RepID=UPI0035ADBD4D
MTEPTTQAQGDEPLNQFTNCHGGILRRLNMLDELPGLLGPAARARLIAEQALSFFREAIFEHHLEEERELFPAVIASAEAGSERERVQSMADRLTREHRVLEELWKSLEKDLKRVAKGMDADLDTVDVHRLVREYSAHARFEESEFLPLAHTILGRNDNHMAALGLSLHMRHQPTFNAHI